MDIFKNIFSKSAGTFSFKANGNIWRMYFNNEGYIAGEVRNLDRKNLSFFALNYKDNTINFKDVELPEKWWASIEFLTESIIFISKFKKPDMPDQKGIIAMNLNKGEVLWENEELTFIFGDNEFSYGYKQLFETRKFYKIDNENGEIVEEVDNLSVDRILKRKDEYNVELYQNCKYAVQYKLDDTDNEFINNIINTVEANKNISDYLEYISYENMIVYNYHIETKINPKNIENKYFDNILKIYDINKNALLFEDILNKDASGFAPDSFFIKENYLIYIKNKNELIIHNLNRFEDSK